MRKLKVFLSVMLALTLIIPTGIINAFASDATEDAYLYYVNNFDISASGLSINQKSETIEIKNEGDNRYLDFTSVAATGDFYFDLVLTDALAENPSDNVVLEFDVKTNESSKASMSIRFKDANAEQLNFASISASGIFKLAAGSNSSEALSSSDWTTISIAIDFANLVADVYVGGAVLESDVALAEAGAYTGLRQFRFYCAKQSAGKNIKIDNIKVYAGEAPSAVNTLVSAPSSASYERLTDIAGNAYGTVSITAPEVPDGIEGYELYWGNEDGALLDWAKIAELSCTEGESENTFTFENGVSIPKNANKIIVFSKKGKLYSEPYEIDIEEGALLSGEAESNFFVISDLHIISAKPEQQVKGFESIVANVNDKTLAVFGVGDSVTDPDKEVEWPSFANLIKTYFTDNGIDFYTTLGNHEFRGYDEQTCLELFYQYNPTAPHYYYYNVIGGKYFIHTWPLINITEQIEWMDELLDTAYNRGMEAYVFCHFPLQNTVGVSSSNYIGDYQDEFKAVIDSHSNATMFSGHTHANFYDNRAAYIGNNETASYYHVANFASYSKTASYGGGLYVENYADYDLVYAMDLRNDVVVPTASYIIPKGFKEATKANADLESVTVNGENFEEFKADVYEYMMTVEDDFVLDTLEAVPFAGGAKAEVSITSDNTGYSAVIEVTAADGETTKTYTIDFRYKYKVINGYNVFKGAIGYNTSVTDENELFNVTEGVVLGSWAYSNRQYDGQTTVSVLADELLGSSVIRFQKNGGAFNTKKSGGTYYWSTEYVGEDGKYFTEFELTSPATVIVATLNNWPAQPDGWEKYSELKLKPAGANYYRHFEAGETVSLPSWGNTTTSMNPGAGYWIVWDDISSADLKSLSYSVDGETAAIEGFDKDTTEYEIKVSADAKSASLSGEAVFARNLEVWGEGNDCAKVAYSKDTIDLASEDTISVTVTSRNATAQKTYTVKFVKEEAEYSVTVNSNSGKIFAGVDGGEAADWGTSNTESFKSGTKIEFAAEALENVKFMYWIDANSNVILSCDESFSHTVGTDRSIAAIYVGEADVFVSFTSLANKLVASGISGSVAVPENPYVYGYKFDGWYANGEKAELAVGETVTAEVNTEYKAGFKKDATTYEVTVDGSVTEYTYNEKVTLTADAEKDGATFSYWKRDNEIVSYNTSYSFYVNDDTTVEAIYGETAEGEIVLAMAAPVLVDGTKIAFFAERDIPVSYELIETGILIGTVNDLTVDSAQYKATAKSTANKGQYTVRKANVLSGETWYGAAYAIYREGDGSVYTAYSNEVRYTVE